MLFGALFVHFFSWGCFKSPQASPPPPPLLKESSRSSWSLSSLAGSSRLLEAAGKRPGAGEGGTLGGTRCGIFLLQLLPTAAKGVWGLGFRV